MAKMDACGIYWTASSSHSIDIISTCYVYENRRKWFHSWTCENAAGKFEIDDPHLQIIESISLKSSVENSSAQWAIFHGGDLVSLITFEGTILYQAVSCLVGQIYHSHFKVLRIYILRM